LKVPVSHCARRRATNEVDIRIDNGADGICMINVPESSIIWR
jgi:hypothetical protein